VQLDLKTHRQMIAQYPRGELRRIQSILYRCKYHRTQLLQSVPAQYALGPEVVLLSQTSEFIARRQQGRLSQ
jgi:hypothetical protein